MIQFSSLLPGLVPGAAVEPGQSAAPSGGGFAAALARIAAVLRPGESPGAEAARADRQGVAASGSVLPVGAETLPATALLTVDASGEGLAVSVVNAPDPSLPQAPAPAAAPAPIAEPTVTAPGVLVETPTVSAEPPASPLTDPLAVTGETAAIARTADRAPSERGDPPVAAPVRFARAIAARPLPFPGPAIGIRGPDGDAPRSPDIVSPSSEKRADNAAQPDPATGQPPRAQADIVATTGLVDAPVVAPAPALASSADPVPVAERVAPAPVALAPVSTRPVAAPAAAGPAAPVIPSADALPAGPAVDAAPSLEMPTGRPAAAPVSTAPDATAPVVEVPAPAPPVKTGAPVATALPIDGSVAEPTVAPASARVLPVSRAASTPDSQPVAGAAPAPHRPVPAAPYATAPIADGIRPGIAPVSVEVTPPVNAAAAAQVTVAPSPPGRVGRPVDARAKLAPEVPHAKPDVGHVAPTPGVERTIATTVKPSAEPASAPGAVSAPAPLVAATPRMPVAPNLAVGPDAAVPSLASSSVLSASSASVIPQAVPAAAPPVVHAAPVEATAEPAAPLVTGAESVDPATRDARPATLAPVALASVLVDPARTLPSFADYRHAALAAQWRGFGGLGELRPAAVAEPVRLITPVLLDPALAPGAAATVAVAPTPMPVIDMRDLAWPAAMLDRIEALRDMADANDTRIKLAPDALGEVEVRVRREGDTVHVRFAAEAPATRTILVDAQPRLAELAEARGLKLGSTGVDAGAGQQGQGGERPQRRDAAPETRTNPNRSTPHTDATDADARIA